jgi:quercetin dioxygenase-like cupin family protein
MTIINSDAAPVFDIPGVRFTGLASPQRGSRENSVWRVHLEPGAAPVIHKMTREEIFVALAGSAQLHIDGTVHDLAAGGAAIVRPGVDFGLANPGDTPFEAVVVLPVGGQAKMPGEPPFTPPWAE